MAEKLISEFEVKHPKIAGVVDRVIENPVGRAILLPIGWLISGVAAAVDDDFRIEMITGMEADVLQGRRLSRWQTSRLWFLSAEERFHAREFLKAGVELNRRSAVQAK